MKTTVKRIQPIITKSTTSHPSWNIALSNDIYRALEA